ncbi:DUF438 domain-containing protein [Candidatus Aminicenantes bacterium AC-708-M15]|nr:DUF438 domain-containing protein [SCandidatus Aminicenantes bacterium Aminicenantia_JdfR_composite]MCP2604267.1 DUF438 domain-containing protein [Candidatus Aminicenantes bacterium AC-708-M15]MCP2620787.1 DUF438 domain-containing protein [Candidatus Aminicenantes bacterium AC-334-E05]
MNKLFTKKEALKELIKRLHKGEDPRKIKQEFKELLKQTAPNEIAKVEEELIKEGMPKEEIHKLCDVHLALFQESLGQEEHIAPEGHPIHILMEEHKMLLKFSDELKKIINEMRAFKDLNSAGEKREHLIHIIEHLKSSESHYEREENVLFPYLEKHGVTQPPAIMWMEHNKIREIKKGIYKLVDEYKKLVFEDFVKRLEESAMSLAEIFSNHFLKENKILFPTALNVIKEDEWIEIRKEFDELGYCCFTPEVKTWGPEIKAGEITSEEKENLIKFETGSLSREEIEGIFNTLPIDITFVDKEDTVRYFSQSKERIFTRTKAVIGRKVQQCHPQKSIHIVNQILEDFKKGKREVAEFWINFQGRLIYIRYFPVRNEKGEYLGCLEVTQDISDIKKIEGEKRLL